MLQAQLKGKLTRKEEDMEDLLTSNVFGSIKYVSPREGLTPILTASEDLNGGKWSQSLQEIAEVQYEFWPQLRQKGCNPCEPDLLIRIRFANGQKAILLVEAKHHSDKSSFADGSASPTDQLAMEWQNLARIAEAEKRTPILLFVTADIGIPSESITESQNELRSKDFPEMTVFWISWRRISSLFSESRDESILGDLVKVLRRIGMTFYEGKTAMESIYIAWEFKSRTVWTWSFDKISLKWKLCLTKVFNWKFRNTATIWRFGN